jgi:uncharacterized membrane protein
MRLFLSAVFLACGSGAALADFQVCNDSGIARSLAIGYGSKDKWTSEGWWIIPAGDCKAVISGPLQSRFIYWRATAPDQEFPHENYMFCTQAKPFTIEGAEDCEARGYETAGFKVADTGTEPDYTLMLTDANSGPQAAAPAEAKPAAAKPPASKPPAGFDGPVPASGPGFTPGQAGEPFAQSALLQGCGPQESGPACTFYAEGWHYILRQGGVTPSEIFDTLAGLPINTPVQITGEILSEGDASAEVNLSQIEPGPTDPWAKLRATLQGNWVSLDDPQARMTVNGSEMTDIYGAETMGTSVVTLGDTCADGSGADGPALTVVDPRYMDEAPLCLAVAEVSANKLTLINLPRGNLLTYQRE